MPVDVHFCILIVRCVVFCPDKQVHPYRNYHHVSSRHDLHHKSILSCHHQTYHVLSHDHTTPTQIRRTSNHYPESYGNNPQNLPVHFPYYGNTLRAKMAYWHPSLDIPQSHQMSDTSCYIYQDYHNYMSHHNCGSAHSHTV